MQSTIRVQKLTGATGKEIHVRLDKKRVYSCNQRLHQLGRATRKHALSIHDCKEKGRPFEFKRLQIHYDFFNAVFKLELE